jgi:hypothetical protein
VVLIWLCGFLAAGLFWAAATRRRRWGDRILLVALPGAAFGVALAWTQAYNSGRCDEACYPNSGWESTMGAWQWDALFWSTILGFVGLVVAGVFIARRSRAALLRLVVAALAFAAYALLNAPLTSDY